MTKLEELGHRIKSAFSSFNNYDVTIASSQLYSGLAEGLFDDCIHEHNGEKSEIDLYILVSKISFQLQIEIAATIRQRLTKIAESIAIIARQGVAAEHPPSAIYEVVVGYLSNSAGSMLILLPEEGLQGALSNVQDLIKHSWRVRRGKV